MAYLNRSRTRRARVAIPMAFAGVFVGTHAATADPRLAPPEQRACTIATVASGDTMSRLGRDHGLTLDQVIGLNGHIANPNLIYPGDEIVVGCTISAAPAPTVPPTTTAAPAPVPVEAAMQRIEKPVTIPWPGHNPFLPGEQVVDGVASQGLILRSLYTAGARGNQLVGLAAVTEGESNRRLNAEGDQHLADRTWDASVSPWQIRSANDQRGKGTARDIDALRADPLGHGAQAAIEIYNAALAKGKDPLSPWTCHQIGDDRSFVEPYRQLADAMGMLR